MRTKASGFDAVIVGSGATGSWAAKLLTESGLRVMVLDSGGSSDDQMAEGSAYGKEKGGGECDSSVAEASSASRQHRQSQCYAYGPTTHHLFVDDVEQPYETPDRYPFIWVRTRVVGGRTVLWHRVALRMSDSQFSAASTDGVGVDWPIRYSDLQSHYDAVERFFGVTGIKEELDEVPDGIFLPTNLPATGEKFREAVQGRWPDRRVTALRRASLSSTQENCESPGERRAPYPTCSAGRALADAHGTARMTLRMHSKVVKIVTDR